MKTPIKIDDLGGGYPYFVFENSKKIDQNNDRGDCQDVTRFDYGYSTYPPPNVPPPRNKGLIRPY